MGGGQILVVPFGRCDFPRKTEKRKKKKGCQTEDLRPGAEGWVFERKNRSRGVLPKEKRRQKMLEPRKKAGGSNDREKG